MTIQPVFDESVDVVVRRATDLLVGLEDRKQIAMMVMLGLLLTVGALMAIYPQHASADTTTNPNGNGRNYDNGYFGDGIASNPDGQKGQNASPDGGTNAFNDNHLNHPNYTTG
jgi:hypothetical protein